MQNQASATNNLLPQNNNLPRSTFLRSWYDNLPGSFKSFIPCKHVLEAPIPCLAVLDRPLQIRFLDALDKIRINSINFLPKKNLPNISQIQRAIRAQANTSNRRRPQGAEAQQSSAPLFHQGVIEKGTSSVYSVDGINFYIDRDTWIVGQVRIGAFAKVRSVSSSNGSHRAIQIIIKDQGTLH